jgi:hypothetical protein
MTDIDRLRTTIESIPLFDSHSHAAGFDFGTPLDDRQGRSLPQILVNDYLWYLASSCCSAQDLAEMGRKWQVADAEAQFRAIQPLLEQCRGLSTYAVLREGIRELFAFQETDIALDNWRRINDQVVETYRSLGERAWLREVARKANVFRQVQICMFPYVAEHWQELPADERAAQAALLLPSLVLDAYFFSGFVANNEARERSKALLGRYPKDYDEFLDFCGAVLDRFMALGGNSVKLLAAYVRTLHFERVDDREARDLFRRGVPSLDSGGLRKLQDNLAWHLFRMAGERGLPMLVHTGYSTPTEWADPEHLIGLLADPGLRGLKIGLCHAGWGFEEAALMMARTYRNCYFDLSWVPMLSPEKGRQALSMAIDVLPANKIMVGTDCGTAESFLGAARLIRRMVADVLTEKVRCGQFQPDVAERLARKILVENACEFFGVPCPRG